MHILFYGKEQVKLLESGKLEGILAEKSIKASMKWNIYYGGSCL